MVECSVDQDQQLQANKLFSPIEGDTIGKQLKQLKVKIATRCHKLFKKMVVMPSFPQFRSSKLRTMPVDP